MVSSNFKENEKQILKQFNDSRYTTKHVCNLHGMFLGSMKKTVGGVDYTKRVFFDVYFVEKFEFNFDIWKKRKQS